MIKDLNSIPKNLTKIDMHTHTEYSHDCNTKLKDFGNLLMKNKLGVSVTDHNEIQGSLKLKKMFPKLLVIPGIEITSITNKDVLLYFNKHSDLESFYTRHILPNKKLNRRTNKTTLSTNYVLDIAKDYNAFRVLPHPFMRIKGSARFLKKNPEMLKQLDGIEVLNASKIRRDNKKSLEWCTELKMPFTAGSDSHLLSTLGNALTLANSNSPEDIIEEIIKKQNTVIGDSDKFYSALKGLGVIVKNKLKSKRISKL
jgi:predicted metal-dependent phosphoesterase TrpH